MRTKSMVITYEIVMDEMPAEAREMRTLLARFLSRARSIIIKPIPPRTNMNPEDSPSMMYCPLTLPGRKTTGFTAPVAGSCVLPMPGGSTITS
ncbi:unnamed protein product [Victoria cruziana]